MMSKRRGVHVQAWLRLDSPIDKPAIIALEYFLNNDIGDENDPYNPPRRLSTPDILRFALINLYERHRNKKARFPQSSDATLHQLMGLAATLKEVVDELKSLDLSQTGDYNTYELQGKIEKATSQITSFELSDLAMATGSGLQTVTLESFNEDDD